MCPLTGVSITETGSIIASDKSWGWYGADFKGRSLSHGAIAFFTGRKKGRPRSRPEMFSPSSVRTDSFLDASLGLLSTPAKLLLRTLKLKGSSSRIELAPFITKCTAGNPLLLSVVEARQPGKSEQHRPHGSPSLSSSSYLCVTGATRSHIAQRVLNIEQLIYPRGVFFFLRWFGFSSKW